MPFIPFPLFPIPPPFIPFDEAFTGADVRTGCLVLGGRVLGGRAGTADALVGGSVLFGLLVTGRRVGVLVGVRVGDLVGEQVDFVIIVFMPFLLLPALDDFEPFPDFDDFPEQSAMPVDGFCTDVRTGAFDGRCVGLTGFFVGLLGLLVGNLTGGPFPTVATLGAWDPVD